MNSVFPRTSARTVESGIIKQSHYVGALNCVSLLPFDDGNFSNLIASLDNCFGLSFKWWTGSYVTVLSEGFSNFMK